MSVLDVLNKQGKKVNTVELDDKVFDGKVSQSLIHQAVVTFLANQRKGLACTKTRGKVRGGGKKPWRQKGTGRSRHGSSRSPLWRGGGTTFGPLPRDYSKDFPKRMKVLALKSALNAKLKDDQIMVIDAVSLKDHKTQGFNAILQKLKLSETKTKMIVDSIDFNLKLASRNIEKCKVEKADVLTTYDAVDCKKIVFTVDAFNKVQERIKKWLK